MKKKFSWIVGILAALVVAGVISKGWFCGQYPDHSLCVAPTPSPTVEPTPTPTVEPTPTPTVEPTPTPTPEPTPTVTPPPNEVCLAGQCPLEKLYINAKTAGPNYVDSTMRCRNRAYCEKATGIPGTVDCALGEEGTSQRRICELAHAPKCHRWFYMDLGGAWTRCGVEQHPVASCDHYDRYIDWQGPYVGYCETRDDGYPIAGYQTVPHGKTKFMACGWGYSASVCSNPLDLDR